MSVKRLAVIPHVAALESGAEPHVFDLDQLFADMIALQREGKKERGAWFMTMTTERQYLDNLCYSLVIPREAFNQ